MGAPCAAEVPSVLECMALRFGVLYGGELLFQLDPFGTGTGSRLLLVVVVVVVVKVFPSLFIRNFVRGVKNAAGVSIFSCIIDAILLLRFVRSWAARRQCSCAGRLRRLFASGIVACAGFPGLSVEP